MRANLSLAWWRINWRLLLKVEKMSTIIFCVIDSPYKRCDARDNCMTVPIYYSGIRIRNRITCMKVINIMMH